MTEERGRPLKLVHCAIGAGGGGGVERMDTFYHRFIDRKRFDPRFVILGAPKPGEAPYDPSIEYLYTGVENRWGRLLKLFADADIVQFSGGFEPLVCEAARVSGVPVLVEIMHLTEPGQLFDYIDVSICVSETVRRAQLFPDRATVIHNGMDADQFPFRTEPYPEDRIVLLESSRREKPKHFHLDELAADILPLDPRIEIRMAGRSQRGRSSGRVKFLGLRDDIAAQYRQADLMILLSRLEPFGLAALEAMASGALPLVSGDGGMAEIVTHGVDGWLVAAHDKAKVIGAIEEALALRGTETWFEMRRAARRAVEQKFSGRACVERYERVYLDLAARKGRRTAPGPVDAAPAPEALVGDALFYFNADDWGGVEQRVDELAGHGQPLRTPRCAAAMTLLARQCQARNRAGLADMIYGKLHASGFRGADWMKHWLEAIPDGAKADGLVEELLAMDPDDAALIMLAAERDINAGRPRDALERLEEAARRLPDNDELGAVRALLKKNLDAREEG